MARQKMSYQEKKNAVRQKAVDWQTRFNSRGSVSWGNLVYWQDHFYRLGRRYGLLNEFHENGIL